MPRHRRLRKVVTPPGFQGYKPFGTNRGSKEIIELNYEEYEAIKLADYDRLTHLEASKLMAVSRATFARIYDSARKKIAKALVEVATIKSVFGNAVLGKNWFLCLDCASRFTIPTPAFKHICPLCSSKSITSIK